MQRRVMYGGPMTDTAKNESNGAPLTWRSKKVWGSEGNTHYADVTLDNGDAWSFTVDSPRKGFWVARGWRNGDFALYREDRTMKGAKAQAQAHANLAHTSTCGTCRQVGGHKPDCGPVLPTLVNAVRAASDTFQQVGMAAALASHGLKKLARGIQGGVWNNIHRPAGCTCPTPTHRMSCGHGGRVVVIPAGA